MAVMISDNKKDLVINCKCGCHNAIHITVDDTEKDSDYYSFITYMNANWYRDQNDGVIQCFTRKLKKIWRIIRNKDYCYSEIMMSCDDFEQLKKYINQF